MNHKDYGLKNLKLKATFFSFLSLLIILITLFLLNFHNKNLETKIFFNTIKYDLKINNNAAFSKSISNFARINSYRNIIILNDRNIRTFQYETSGNNSKSLLTHTISYNTYFDRSKTKVQKTIKFSYSLNKVIYTSIALWLFTIILILIATRHLQDTLKKNYNIKLKIQKAEIATQVAHDIRSPLAALKGVTYNLKLESNDPNYKILNSTIDRINGIAAELLDVDKQFQKINTNEYDSNITNDTVSITTKENISLLLDLIITEKKISQADTISIHSNIATELYADINKSHFTRVISNLLNNSIEALDSSGKVAISIKSINDRAIITISDNGPGIPTDIISKIFDRGYTTKDSGNGLGLAHAKMAIESWNGQLELKSSPDGTIVTITLSLSAPPPEVSLPYEEKITDRPSLAILLDDDELLHITWEMKAKKAGVKLQCYSNPQQLMENLEQISTDTPIYIDSSLGDGVNGEDIAQELHQKGFTELYLATGFEPEHFANLDFLKGILGKTPPF